MMDFETTCTPCITTSSLQALLIKEDRAEYCVVREGQQLEDSYKRLSAQFSSPAAASMDIRTRYQAVEFLMEQIDNMQEDREVVGYAMNYLDRFVALQLNSSPDVRIRLNKTDHQHNKNNNKADSLLDRSYGKYCLAMYCLVALDLSIRMHAPTSGDALRNAVHRVSDRSDMDPSATYATVTNYLGDCVRSSSGDLHQKENYPRHVNRFVEEVQREFHSDDIYHSTRFATLRRLSGHDDCEDFSQAQMILIWTLDFYLHPVLPNAIMTDMMQFLSTMVNSVLNVNDLECITSYALYQVELSNYSVEFINAKPSLIAFSAISNVMKVMFGGDSDVLRAKLSARCSKATGMSFDSKAMSRIRHSLFRLWKESYPRSIQQISRIKIAIETDCDDERKDFEAPKTTISTVQDRSLASPDTITASFYSAPKIEACDSDSIDSDSSTESAGRKRPKITSFESLDREGLDRAGCPAA